MAVRRPQPFALNHLQGYLAHKKKRPPLGLFFAEEKKSQVNFAVLQDLGSSKSGAEIVRFEIFQKQEVLHDELPPNLITRDPHFYPLCFM